MANGHPHAAEYPIGAIWQEAIIVQKRQLGERYAAALLSRMAIASIPNMAVAPEATKEQAKEFFAMLNEHMGG